MVMRLNTALFVPATKLDLIAKAVATGTDMIIVDLEDAVAANNKASARNDLANYLSDNSQQSTPIWLRINDANSVFYQDDIKLCAQHHNIAGIVLAKTENAEQIQQTAEATYKPIIPLLESATGMINLPSIATQPAVQALTYGVLDFANELGFDASKSICQDYSQLIRFQLLLHSQINGLLPPLDTVYPNFHDRDGLQQHASNLKALGMGGMLCIHPSQVGIVQAAFKPSAKTLEWAKQVVTEHEKTGLAAFQIDGKMVDLPVIERAKRILNK